MLIRSSSTFWMKHAEHCGREYASSVSKIACSGSFHAQLPREPVIPYSWWSPQLNHTGELKAPY